MSGDDGCARLVFRGELVDLLRQGHVDGNIRYPLGRRASIKDVVESVGVPHTEIYGVLADNESVGFDHLLLPGKVVELLSADIAADNAAVPDAAWPVDVTRATLLRPEPLSELRFVVDENVARLAMLLRAMGFDAAYDRDWDDPYIARMAFEEGRFVLTADRALLKRSCIAWGRLVRSRDPDGQLAEVTTFLGIRRAPAMFRRCLRCNVETVSVEKAEILHLLEPKTILYHNVFRRCPQCGRVYWPGTHQQEFARRLAALDIRAE
ncbi:Mut7-C RNAse domain-containing protein [Pseudodesulfovibrio senegalensis]|uniref:Twitching motility protein PilT n=1 Tax=Pseudodesulfovibrio senegalensis TaxID=1721087 RepID=A0A6N6MZ68_9BACT|nr:Mut7-C RNAse domain-containing protein [Pseudodesulfovibrio senegalensis]KAB1438814.1 hypothetical protein F8A88_15255 [Pseudodesulfovibrio senegalensis]